MPYLRRIKTVVFAVTFLGLAAFSPLTVSLWADPLPTPVSLPPSIAGVQSSYGKLPLSFEANHGQADSSVKFLTRGPGHTLFLTPSDAVLTLGTGAAKSMGESGDATQGAPSSTSPFASSAVVRMTFEGANPQAEAVGLDQLPGIVNYLIGDDPSQYRTHIPTYQKVAYTNVYPGIDLVYYGNQGHLNMTSSSRPAPIQT